MERALTNLDARSCVKGGIWEGSLLQFPSLPVAAVFILIDAEISAGIRQLRAWNGS